MHPVPKLSAHQARRGAHLRRLIEWIRRGRSSARARRAVESLDSRTLRDIGLTRQEVVFIRVNRR